MNLRSDGIEGMGMGIVAPPAVGNGILTMREREGELEERAGEEGEEEEDGIYREGFWFRFFFFWFGDLGIWEFGN